MAKRENYSKCKAEGRNKRHGMQAIMKLSEYEKYKSPAMQVKLIRAAHDYNKKRWVESWLLRKLLLKLMKDPKKVLEFVEYDND